MFKCFLIELVGVFLICLLTGRFLSFVLDKVDELDEQDGVDKDVKLDTVDESSDATSFV